MDGLAVPELIARVCLGPLQTCLTDEVISAARAAASDLQQWLPHANSSKANMSDGNKLQASIQKCLGQNRSDPTLKTSLDTYESRCLKRQAASKVA